MKIYQDVYFNLKYIFIAIYSLSLIGLSVTSPQYVKILSNIITIVTSLILIYIFNPYFPKKITEFDKKIVFDAGFLLLFSNSLKNILHYLTNNEKIHLDLTLLDALSYKHK